MKDRYVLGVGYPDWEYGYYIGLIKSYDPDNEGWMTNVDILKKLSLARMRKSKFRLVLERVKEKK